MRWLIFETAFRKLLDFHKHCKLSFFPEWKERRGKFVNFEIIIYKSKIMETFISSSYKLGQKKLCLVPFCDLQRSCSVICRMG